MSTDSIMSLPLPKLKPGAASILDNLLREKIAEETVPSIFWAATNAKEQIYENQGGHVIMGDESSGEVNRDTTLELFSMTKFITCLAILQFVEQGVVELDDPDQMYTHLPELGTLQVLEGYDEGKAILVPQKNRITLRMLMNHTSGSVHALRHPKLKQWFDAQSPPIPWLFTTEASIRTICAPLIFQPGTSWAYSCGTDWIGVLINRLSGLSFEEYLRQNVFARVEGSMPDTTFYPRPDLVARKAGVYERVGDSLKYYKFWPGRAQTPETVSKKFLSGAGGLFGTTKDYLALCRAVLQCDPRNPTPPKQPIIQPQTFKLLFEPSLALPIAKSEASQVFKNEHYFFLEPNPENMNHSVGFAVILEDGKYGRKAGSGGWSGMAHTHFWLDPTTGLAGVCNTQICGPNPDPWNKIFNDFEKTLYENLRE